MAWMCQNEEASREDYLLGKRIKNLNDLALLDDVSRRYCKDVDEEILEKTAKQDMMAKMLEDPLYLIKNQEEDRRRKLLQNTVRLKKLQALVKKQSEAGYSKHSSDKLKKKKKKKKTKHKNARSRRRHGSDRKSESNSVSDSPSSSDDSLLESYVKILKSKDAVNKRNAKMEDEETTTVPRGRDESERRREHNHQVFGERDSEYRSYRRQHNGREVERSYHGPRERRSDRASREYRDGKRRYQSPTRDDSMRDEFRDRRYTHREFADRDRIQSSDDRKVGRSVRDRSPKGRGLHGNRDRSFERTHRVSESGECASVKSAPKRSDEEMARLREEMMSNARNRDEERKQRVANHIHELQSEKEKETVQSDFISSAMMKHASRSSLEEEVKRRAFKRQKLNSGAIHDQTSFVRR